MKNNEEVEIDESLYSRQLYVVGKDAMKKMMNSRVLVMGLDGLGQEVAKNICLAGVSKVTLFDDRIVEEEDLCTGFYLRREDIGKARDASVVEKFRSMNEYVDVSVASEVNNFEGYDVVVVCNEGYGEQIKLNEMARKDKCMFVGCQVRGLFSQVFCDFGAEFICVDRTGEIPMSGMINDISEDGVMTVVDGQRHNLEDYDIIKITQCEEYEGKYFRVKVISPTQVMLQGVDGVRMFEEEAEFKAERFKSVYGGDFEQQKKPSMISFKPLGRTIDEPRILGFNYEVEERNLVIHKCFVALGEYMKQSKQTPSGEEFLSFFVRKYKSHFEFEALIRSFGRQCGGTLMPMCSVVGGFVAQEILKAVGSRFTPLHQFFYFDAMDVVPGDPKDDGKDYGRYGPMVRCLGKECVEKLFNLHVFMVGAGAIGCEHLKNMVMCGIGSRGRVSVTDMDAIEQSNLNRQFLFRSGDVSSMKAEIAVGKAIELNEDFLKIPLERGEEKLEGKDVSEMTNGMSGSGLPYSNLVYYNLKVGKETESVFSDRFFQSVDVVATALDNVDARIYVDGRCVVNRKFMVDAGTSGTKGNVQVVVPFHTESYGSSQDPPEKSIPLCTIKNFPYAIEHTIEWARSEFEFKFHDEILLIKEYLGREKKNGGEGKEEASNETMEDIVEKTPRSAKECIRNGILLFVKLFHTSIKNLITAFPPDSKTKEGQPFWMPPKRSPVTISFDVNNSLHVLFVQSTANIFSFNFGIGEHISREMVVDFVKNEILVEEFSSAVDNICVEESPRPPVDPSAITPCTFEKDDDSNFHVDFLYAAANLRAMNYKIKQADRLTVKGIAGRIIPAIATTTAVVSGLAILEMIKYALGVEHTKHKNSFLNLALPFFASTDPVEPMKQLYKIENKKYTFTLWNRLEYKDSKLGTILKAFEIQFKKKISMVTAENALIYWDFDSKYADNLEKTVGELVGRKPDELFVMLDVITDDEEGEFPRIVVVFE
ncbi:ubiquitin-activating enzyme E1 [Encephalitozoon intestinalis ATCC 50506]|uniref:Ubiquitin-activating enzyme E1 n=1 Tax=Encephalitozoon intestinalis (strain ATCC 50506) TaxID=876142 RepID=E0S691_ENCIT|nr:ubiquitin-activating enzyme E1 [Encephalitozoon intestinalis ATCC 50506]ADM11226.1 ubiquitin-activating enzyme E1 [Encephalitozoon intestinalis ATCC 50506]UTX44894.1 ubiquitin-activating enzyme E1 [Encephalitozoon intestinalis]